MSGVRGFALLVLIAAALGSTVAAAPAASTATCRVPKVTGLTLLDARAKLKAATCPARMTVVGACVKAKSNQGVILDQKPRPKLVLRKGGKVSVHVGKDCPEPPPPPPVPPTKPGDFTGYYDGTYSGAWENSNGCPDSDVSGNAEIWVEQTGALTFNVHFYLEAFAVDINADDCKEYGRRDGQGITPMTFANGKLVATGFMFTLSGNKLMGAIEARGGKFGLTLTKRPS
jgi:hypothetical protein